MKGMMATLLTLTLAGFANGQQFNQLDNSRRQYSDSDKDSYARPIPMLANSFDKELVDRFRNEGELHISINREDTDKIGQIVFGFENTIKQFENRPDLANTNPIKPVLKQDDTIVFEFSETDLKAIENGTLRYELNSSEIGKYRNVVVRMRGFTPGNNRGFIPTSDDRFASNPRDSGTNTFSTGRSGQAFQSDREFDRDREFNRNLAPIRERDQNLIGSSGTRGSDYRSLDANRQSQFTGNDTGRIKDNYLSSFGQGWADTGGSGSVWDRSSSARRDSRGFASDLYGGTANQPDGAFGGNHDRDYRYGNSNSRSGFVDQFEGGRSTTWNDSTYRDGYRIGDRLTNRSGLAGNVRDSYPNDRYADASGLSGTAPGYRNEPSLPYEERLQRDRIQQDFVQRGIYERDDKIEKLIQQNDILANQLRQVQSQLPEHIDSRYAQNDIPGRSIFNQTPKISSNDPGGLRSFQTHINGNRTDLNNARQPSSETPTYILLLCSLGLNAYLGWISRNFYVRYSELADELRETFSASISS